MQKSFPTTWVLVLAGFSQLLCSQRSICSIFFVWNSDGLPVPIWRFFIWKIAQPPSPLDWLKIAWHWTLNCKACMICCRQEYGLLQSLPPDGTFDQWNMWRNWGLYLIIMSWFLWSKWWYSHIHTYTGGWDPEVAGFFVYLFLLAQIFELWDETYIIGKEFSRRVQRIWDRENWFSIYGDIHVSILGYEYIRIHRGGRLQNTPDDSLVIS